MLARLQRHHDALLFAVGLLGLAAGTMLHVSGAEGAGLAWTLGTMPVLAGLLIQIATALRRGDVGLDIVAALSMSAALAFGEPLAGNVVALMYAGGQLLETFAAGRARREMTALLGRVAHTAMRYAGTTLEEVPIAAIGPGDRLLIRHGEVLPVDGIIAGSRAELDLSALTGESLPVRVLPGGEALSGATLLGDPVDLLVTRPAAESTYAGIVRLVETAQTSRAPMARLADRYALWFLLLTLLMAGGAWLLSQDHLRALAVLVVATPCPLILAVPVALISGLSRTASMGVLVKHGGMLEALARVTIAVLDKTGTLTEGVPAVTRIRAAGSATEDDVLYRAASLDQASTHSIATALIQAAAGRGLSLSNPVATVEQDGDGLSGQVDGRHTTVGGLDWVGSMLTSGSFADLADGLPVDAMIVAVAVEGRPFGLIILQDRLRPDAVPALAALRAAGVRRIVLASGDRATIARAIGDAVGVDSALGDLRPADKLDLLQRERRAAAGGAVLMVGDGVNDAPALAAADIGVAMGARGAAAASEAAGVVLLVDALAPLAKAITIARRSRTIALQSVFAGLGLSIAAMLAAALGYLPPVQGALLQEAIDVAVILNALRALR